MRSLRKMQLAAAAGTGAAVASYAVDRPLQASLFLAAVPLSVVAILPPLADSKDARAHGLQRPAAERDDR